MSDLFAREATYDSYGNMNVAGAYVNAAIYSSITFNLTAGYTQSGIITDMFEINSAYYLSLQSPAGGADQEITFNLTEKKAIRAINWIMTHNAPAGHQWTLAIKGSQNNTDWTTITTETITGTGAAVNKTYTASNQNYKYIKMCILKVGAPNASTFNNYVFQVLI